MEIKHKAASLAGLGGSVVSEAVTAGNYPTAPLSATDTAVAIIGSRFGLTAAVARLVCELATIGGRERS